MSVSKVVVETERLQIVEFDNSMAESVCRLSLDEDNRRFVPDEVFDTADKAHRIIDNIIECYSGKETPLIYAITLNNQHIGHVQAVPLEDSNWEIGYHTGKEYTCKGYATEAVKAFLPYIMKRLKITKIYGQCHAENMASLKVLERSSFVLEYKGKGHYHGKIQEICKYVYSL